MASTTVYNSKYGVVSEDVVKSIKANEIFIRLGSNVVKLTDFLVPTGSIDSGKQPRKIKSWSDFQTQLAKNNLYYKDAQTGAFLQAVAPIPSDSILREGAVPEIPTTFETTKYSSSAIPAPTEAISSRMLEVKPANAGEYFYVKLAGKKSWEFFHKDELYIGDPSYGVNYTAGADLSGSVLMTRSRNLVDTIYTETMFEFSAEQQREVVNIGSSTMVVKTKVDDVEVEVSLPPFSKAMISNSTGEIVGDIKKLNAVVSDQHFDSVEEEINGKKQKRPIVHVKNYQVVSTKPSADDYISVVIDNAVRMVQVKSLRDLNNNKITDITTMVNQPVQLDTGEMCETLTYEQVHMAYQTTKVYREIEGENPTETSCLRLANGRHVNELESVQPLSYKIAEFGVMEKDVDKYLVSINGKWNIVDKDYYAKHNNFDKKKAIPLVRCDFNSKECAVVQMKTTKGGGEPEPCAIIKKQVVKNMASEDIELEPDGNNDKETVLAGFKTAYKKGDYTVEDIFIDGERYALEENSRRYEYTDDAIFDDVAESSFTFRSLKPTDVTFKDGNVKGGLKFDPGKFIKSAYAAWGKAALGAITIAPAAGIFIPFLAPLVTVYSVGVLVTAPLIPLAAITIKPLSDLVEKIKNALIPDKVQESRKKQVNEVNAQMLEIFKTFEKSDSLSPTAFETAYANMMQRINMFGQTINANELVVTDGVAPITTANGKFANEQLIAGHKILKQKRKTLVDELKKQEKAIKKKGSNKAVIQAEIDRLKAEIEDIDSKLESFKNGTFKRNYEAHDKLVDMQQHAGALRLYMYVANYLESVDLAETANETNKAWAAEFEKSIRPLLGESFDLTRLSYSNKKSLMIDGVSIFESEKVAKRKLGKDKIDEWLAVKENVMSAVEQVQNSQAEKPQNAEVSALAQAKKQIELKCEEAKSLGVEIASVLGAIEDGFKLKTALAKYESIIIKVDEIAAFGRDTTNLEDANKLVTNLDRILSDLKSTKHIATELQGLAKEQVDAMALFESSIEKFELKSGVSAFIKSIKDPALQEAYQNELVKLIQDGNSTIKAIKTEMGLTQIKQEIETFKNINSGLGELWAKVQNTLTTQSVENMINAAKESFNQVRNAKMLPSLLAVTNEMTKAINGLEEINKTVQESKDDNERENLKQRAVYITRIIQFSAEAIKVLQTVQSKDKKGYFGFANEAIEKMRKIMSADLVKEDENSLKTKMEDCYSLFEYIERLIISTSKTPTVPKGHRFNPVRWQGEAKTYTVLRNIHSIASNGEILTGLSKDLFETLRKKTKLDEVTLLFEIAKLCDELNANIMAQPPVNTWPESKTAAAIILNTTAKELGVDWANEQTAEAST